NGCRWSPTRRPRTRPTWPPSATRWDTSLPSESIRELAGDLEPIGQVVILVSRYHERLTRRLLDGALEACTAAGIAPDDTEVWWVDGAFELGVAAAAAVDQADAVVALGIVI